MTKQPNLAPKSRAAEKLLSRAMYRALPASRKFTSGTGRELVRISRRRLTTETAPHPVPKKKRHLVRNVLFAAVTLTGGFYLGSAFVAYKYQRYYDFFTAKIPLGQALIEYGQVHHWDSLTIKKALDSSKGAFVHVKRITWDKFRSGLQSTETATKSEKPTKAEALKDHKERLKSVAANLKTTVEKSSRIGGVVQHQAEQFSEEVAELIRKAEAALAHKPIKPSPSPAQVPSEATEPPPPPPPPTPVIPVVENAREKSNVPIYDFPLPIGFEPPPGYSKPAPQKLATSAPAHVPVSLPLLSPAVSELRVSEPVVAQLASTIDTLASFVKSDHSASVKVHDVLDSAKTDLAGLASRIERIRDEERTQLEDKLDEQAKEYTLKLLNLEMEMQDKLDGQEDAFNKFFEQEKVKFVQAYREKLDNELRTQTELINERLRAEVIAQGIEMQRRWIREIKVRVEQERGGRLAKLDDLAANIKRLERVTLDNSSYLDENMRVHALWSMIRALHNVIDAPVRKPFRDELRVLRHISVAKEDPLVATTLESLERTDVPDIGIEPYADLASWFSTSVAPRVASVALVPDRDAGVLSHLASHLLSSFRFRRQGLVPGSDVLSVVARAEYYMNEKDLDSATRELNQLKGTAKVLLADWLDAARRRLEVLQALEVIETQATLASLNIV